ncbi:ion transporter [Actinophytocola sp.]|uniref:ion transporter n=1 Tax=Actinophytocola sp. TaxID=1872138 RepID=UPI003D6C44EC
MRSRARALADAPWFSRLIVGVLVVNAIAIGLRTARSVSASLDPLLVSIEVTVVAIFVVEIAIKVTAYGRSFFRGGWNWFDLIVIALSIVPASGTLLMLRTVRILRTFRLISVIPSMRRVVNSLFTAVPGLVSILLLLMLVLYTSAVAAVQMFGTVAPEEFGSLGVALLTMFRVLIEGWPPVTDVVLDARPLSWMFFVGYIVVTGFIVLNLLIAVIVNAMERQVSEAAAAKEEKEERDHHAELMAELAFLRSELAAQRAELAELAGLRETREARPHRRRWRWLPSWSSARPRRGGSSRRG